MKELVFPALFDPAEEKKPNYLLWQALVLAFFESFKFNYETLGSKPAPHDKIDIHPDYFLKHLKPYKPQQHYFDEKSHVHFNSFIGYGNKGTGYPMGNTAASHHFTLEAYQKTWFTPLLYLANWQETFPLLFATDHNYFMESCNSFFLKNNAYLIDQEYPIRCQKHQEFFTPEYFQATNLPSSLLIKNFSPQTKGVSIPDKTIKTLNFCLKIFQTAVLVQGALIEIFGKSDEVNHLLDNWDPPNGKKLTGLSYFRLNLLSFLYLSLHPAATVLCYGLYRNKYGVSQSHRTAFYVRDDNKVIALKDFLKHHLHFFINLMNKYLQENNNGDSQEIITKINAALDLARMFGLGYQTNQEKGENIHKNIPVNFQPTIIAPELKSINFIVEHSENSPLWKIFYSYCGEWWTKDEIEDVLVGQGKNWERLKNSPRSVAVNIFHKLAAYYWQENLAKLDFPDKIRNSISKRYLSIIRQTD